MCLLMVIKGAMVGSGRCPVFSQAYIEEADAYSSVVTGFQIEGKTKV